MHDIVVLNDPKAIRRFFQLTQLKAMELEAKGLKHSRGSVYAKVKKDYGFIGNRQSVIKQLRDLIEREQRATLFAKEN